MPEEPKIDLFYVLHRTFSKSSELEREICHLLHTVLKDGSKISCDNFISKSFASYVLPDIPVGSLGSDTFYFTLMGQDSVKVSFFKNYVRLMKKQHPGFGKACYVDSTPLPNDIRDNPFNALCSHGIGCVAEMTRLILVLDEVTGLPIWYDIIPGNILDINTIQSISEDVAATLDIGVTSMVLDAGYISKELVSTCYVGTQKTVIGRMPARKGYPYKTLYWEIKNLITRLKYDFKRDGYVYFGYKKEIELFGYKEYAYIYVDKYKALKGYNEYRDKHEEEFAAMKDKDKDKDWMGVSFGYFILVSNIDTTPADILTDYYGRTHIETVFKTSKDYLELLPLSKWSDTTVRGKILNDIIATIILLELRKAKGDSKVSTSEIFGKGQALMCFRDKKNVVHVETPSKQLKDYYKILDITIPSCINIDAFNKSVIGI